jgi:GT2 family glycosyltransferase
MQDQAAQLAQMGIPAAVLNSSLTNQQQSVVMQKARDGEYRLLLINDASPDVRIAPLLSQLALQHAHISVATNARNLGFIGTVNRGFSETAGDVVLLNSDAIVTRGWLAKMLVCAASDARIATITPFSNNAEICSYPQMCGNHPWSENDDPEIPNRALEMARRNGDFFNTTISEVLQEQGRKRVGRW